MIYEKRKRKRGFNGKIWINYLIDSFIHSFIHIQDVLQPGQSHSGFGMYSLNTGWEAGKHPRPSQGTSHTLVHTSGRFSTDYQQDYILLLFFLGKRKDQTEFSVKKQCFESLLFDLFFYQNGTVGSVVIPDSVVQSLCPSLDQYREKKVQVVLNLWRRCILPHPS